MTEIVMIAAVARNGVIGNEGRLPWYIPADLKRFKALTMGYPVIMGRKTYDSLPANARPLPGRQNIVVSSKGFSPDEALEEADKSDRVFIIGGGAIYKYFMPIADRLELTLVHQSPEGDVLFPPVSRAEWLETWRVTHDDFTFITLRRRENIDA